MTKPLAVQLYTVRDQIRADGLRPVLQRLADIGFDGVETVDVPGGDPIAAKRLLADVGLAVASAHSWADIADRRAWRRAVADIAGMGTGTVITAGLEAPDYATPTTLARSVDNLNAAAADAARAGLRFGIHNHTAELGLLDGVPVFARLNELLDPAIAWQIDIYWAKAAGFDPSRLIKTLGERVVSLHMKDGTGGHDDPMVAVGRGSLDIRGIVAAADRVASIGWLIVELDRCEAPIFETLAASHAFLASGSQG